MSRNLNLTINGKMYEFTVGDRLGQIPENETLVDTLRDRLGLTGTKRSCGQGACGCCTVIIDGKAVASCLTLTVECEGKKITTIEGLADPVTGELDPIQKAFNEHNAFQCGFCTPGIIMSTKALLDANPNPTEEELKEALSGNYCRCISHYQVIEAVKSII
ncbi:MAG: (2Fe-2S)-binding protein [Clostridiaceae bacterium]|nr:(2Fe-2S)-binding protein [Clostridiaceae bacterium]